MPSLKPDTASCALVHWPSGGREDWVNSMSRWPAFPEIVSEKQVKNNHKQCNGLKFISFICIEPLFAAGIDFCSWKTVVSSTDRRFCGPRHFLPSRHHSVRLNSHCQRRTTDRNCGGLRYRFTTQRSRRTQIAAPVSIRLGRFDT